MDAIALRKEYNDILPKLNDVVNDLMDELNHFIKVKKLNNIDNVKYRVKDIDSFLKKASKEENGKIKYPNPILEIQDIIGFRIIVYYLSDLDKVHNVLKDALYKHIEAKHHKPSSEEDFRYEGKHYIVHIPPAILKKHNLSEFLFPKVFELQILTC